MQRYQSLLSLAGLLGTLALAAPAEAAQFESWQFDLQQNQLVFTTDSSVEPKAQFLFNPARIVIDLPGTTLNQPTINQAIGGSVRVYSARPVEEEECRRFS
ncbi:MAG: AMIN domain-containing protein [Phormidesmis sp.]